MADLFGRQEAFEDRLHLAAFAIVALEQNARHPGADVHVIDYLRAGGTDPLERDCLRGDAGMHVSLCRLVCERVQSNGPSAA